MSCDNSSQRVTKSEQSVKLQSNGELGNRDLKMNGAALVGLLNYTKLKNIALKNLIGPEKAPIQWNPFSLENSFSGIRK